MARKTQASSAAAAAENEQQDRHDAEGRPGLPVVGNEADHGSNVAATLGLGDDQVSDSELSEHVHGGDPADEAGDEPAPPQTPVRARQGDDGRPFCPTHNCLQIASGSKDNHTHYRCPVPGCGTREKRARPQAKVPSEPLRCPRLICRKRLSYLEVVPKFNKVSHLRMCCPNCGFTLDVPRPGFDPQSHSQRPAEDLAAR